jgi:DNA-binding MarR family transcriptional regulator
MTSADIGTRHDEAELEYISAHLLPAAVLLARLLIRDTAGGLSRTEGGVLRALSEAPRRITELAEIEGLAQPTTTLLVKRLEAQGLVRRERQREDERVVLVSITDAGSRALEALRARVLASLRSSLEAMPGDKLSALAAATDALQELNAVLLGGVPESQPPT